MAGKRNIFEDVGGPKVKTLPVKVDVEAVRAGQRRAIVLWLGGLFVLVAVMVVVGGLTRLTDSGLSITEWNVVTGAIPPMNPADWQFQFDLYKASPEFSEQNSTMDLAGFKSIYWWEWGHRLLGRVIGLVWAGGFVWFQTRKAIPTGWTGRLLGIGGLIGLEGAVGWWMVSSGLTGRMVDVASYRLAVHLGLAFVILGTLAWFVLKLRRGDAALLQARRQRQSGLVRLMAVLAVLVLVQVVFGALVAGIDAGRNYPTWPLMAGEFLPTDSFALTPWWSNFFENAAMVQFNHRMLGYGVLALAMLAWWVSRASALDGVKRAFGWMGLAVSGQVALGIVTVVYSAPLGLASLHQVGAMVVFVTVLAARFEALYPRVQKLRG